MLRAMMRPLSGIMLIMGTAIGAGMLALPVVTGLAGFIPAIAINFLCCLFMMATGLLFLEAILWMHDGVNLLSLSQNFLGNWGRIIAAFAFLMLYYCLEVSYCAGGAPSLADILTNFAGISISGAPSYILFGALFGFIVFMGHRTVNRINWVLMIGLLASFVLLIDAGSREVSAGLLSRMDWRLSLAATPVLFGAYGYHNILPSLSSYLQRHIVHLRISIVAGSLITFAIYSLWQWIIIGTLSLEDIQGAQLRGEPITETLEKFVGHPWLLLFAEFFGFFALVTSFLGVSLSMVDFMADGLRVKREGWNRFLLCLVVFVPPVVLTIIYPGIFIEAIGVAGGFGEAILNGLFPIAIVWAGRYRRGMRSQYGLWGGKPMLVALALLTIFIIGIEAKHLFF